MSGISTTGASAELTADELFRQKNPWFKRAVGLPEVLNVLRYFFSIKGRAPSLEEGAYYDVAHRFYGHLLASDPGYHSMVPYWNLAEHAADVDSDDLDDLKRQSVGFLPIPIALPDHQLMTSLIKLGESYYFLVMNRGYYSVKEQRYQLFRVGYPEQVTVENLNLLSRDNAIKEFYHRSFANGKLTRVFGLKWVSNFAIHKRLQKSEDCVNIACINLLALVGAFKLVEARNIADPVGFQACFEESLVRTKAFRRDSVGNALIVLNDVFIALTGAGSTLDVYEGPLFILNGICQQMTRPDKSIKLYRIEHLRVVFSMLTDLSVRFGILSLEHLLRRQGLSLLATLIRSDTSSIPVLHSVFKRTTFDDEPALPRVTVSAPVVATAPSDSLKLALLEKDFPRADLFLASAAILSSQHPLLKRHNGVISDFAYAVLAGYRRGVDDALGCLSRKKPEVQEEFLRAVLTDIVRLPCDKDSRGVLNHLLDYLRLNFSELLSDELVYLLPQSIKLYNHVFFELSIAQLVLLIGDEDMWQDVLFGYCQDALDTQLETFKNAVLPYLSVIASSPEILKTKHNETIWHLVAESGMVEAFKAMPKVPDDHANSWGESVFLLTCVRADAELIVAQIPHLGLVSVQADLNGLTAADYLLRAYREAKISAKEVGIILAELFNQCGSSSNGHIAKQVLGRLLSHSSIVGAYPKLAIEFYSRIALTKEAMRPGKRVRISAPMQNALVAYPFGVLADTGAPAQTVCGSP